MRILRNNKIKIFLTVFLVYLFYIAPGYISAGTNRYLILAKSIVDDKTFNIDKYQPHTRDKAYYKGHCYVGASPGLGLMAAPIYLALKPLLKLIPATAYEAYRDLEFSLLNLFYIFFLALLPGVLIAVLLYVILGEFNLKEKEKILIVFASSFGTTLFYYSTKFVTPSMGTFLLFGSFYILFRFRYVPRKGFFFFLVGLFLGMAVLVDTLLAVGSVLLILYSLTYFRSTKITNYIFMILGGLIIAAVYMYYHYTCFENPFRPATSYSVMHPAIPFSWPKPRIMFELSFGTYRGLFMYMPILLVSAYGIFIFFKNIREKYLPEMIFIAIFFTIMFLLNSGLSIWDAGGDFGPRYLIPIIPFMMIPVAFAFKRIGYKVIFWTAAISIFINWCGIQYGDSDNVFTNIGLFIFRGLNSNLAEWFYILTTTYVRKLNVITHFSPLLGFLVLLFLIYLIWKKEIRSIS